MQGSSWLCIPDQLYHRVISSTSPSGQGAQSLAHSRNQQSHSWDKSLSVRKATINKCIYGTHQLRSTTLHHRWNAFHALATWQLESPSWRPASRSILLQTWESGLVIRSGVIFRSIASWETNQGRRLPYAPKHRAWMDPFRKVPDTQDGYSSKFAPSLIFSLRRHLTRLAITALLGAWRFAAQTTNSRSNKVWKPFYSQHYQGFRWSLHNTSTTLPE